MRWKHPTRGVIPPSDFIPLAEETKLIVRMGAWALRQACIDAKSWQVVLVFPSDLSAVQIENCDLYDVVTEVLEATGLEPHRLQLEITETVLMHDRQRTHTMLRKVQRLGVEIALDDFGTCFATLNYLRSFPFNKIKIDRSFIHDISSQHDNMAIARSVADLAYELNIRIGPEGVETLADLAAVRSAA